MSDNDHVKRLAMAVETRQPLPAMACETMEQGYRLQRQLSAQINGETLADLKAGITAAAAQQQLGLDAPLIGSLYRRGKLVSGCELELVSGQELECEIGVLVDGSGEPLGLLPIVEVVYLDFSRKEDFSLANAVAANLGADRYICGEILPWDGELESVAIRVCKDGDEIASFSNNYSFGSPAAGAAWLVAEARRQGLWQDGSEPRVLSLGTCGTALPGKPGHYRIDFGPLGDISFRVG